MDPNDEKFHWEMEIGSVAESLKNSIRFAGSLCFIFVKDKSAPKLNYTYSANTPRGNNALSTLKWTGL